MVKWSGMRVADWSSGQGCELLIGQVVRDKRCCLVKWSGIGLGTVFRSEKIPRNRLGTVSVIPRKKALIPRHSEFRGIANSEVRNGTKRNGIPRKKIVL